MQRHTSTIAGYRPQLPHRQIPAPTAASPDPSPSCRSESHRGVPSLSRHAGTTARHRPHTSLPVSGSQTIAAADPSHCADTRSPAPIATAQSRPHRNPSRPTSRRRRRPHRNIPISPSSQRREAALIAAPIAPPHRQPLRPRKWQHLPAPRPSGFRAPHDHEGSGSAPRAPHPYDSFLQAGGPPCTHQASKQIGRAHV